MGGILRSYILIKWLYIALCDWWKKLWTHQLCQLNQVGCTNFIVMVHLKIKYEKLLCSKWKSKTFSFYEAWVDNQAQSLWFICMACKGWLNDQFGDMGISMIAMKMYFVTCRSWYYNQWAENFVRCMEQKYYIIIIIHIYWKVINDILYYY